MKWSFEFLKEFCSCGIRDTSFLDPRTNKVYYRSSFRTRALEPFTELHSKWYPMDKKVVPDDLVLTDLIVAIWFADDGSYCFDSRCGVFHTNGFTLEETTLLARKLTKLFDCEFNVVSDTRKRYIIMFNSSTAYVMFKRVIGLCPLPRKVKTMEELVQFKETRLLIRSRCGFNCNNPHSRKKRVDKNGRWSYFCVGCHRIWKDA